ncbi:type VII secretion-associated serine protease mycosin [Streptomyces sp. NPDC048111]|uniref:type VII secretion-associated serine protease mycosin n=1 Tax=Streptomyces sp. NPDC048111 TaxID=3365500 RepID=UPI00371B0C35
MTYTREALALKGAAALTALWVLAAPALAAPAPVLAAPAPALTAPFAVAVAPADSGDGDRCTFPARPYPGRPWALQRVLLDELWHRSTGAGVRVAVIDTGVDIRNPQLKGAVDTSLGTNLLPRGLKDATGRPLERGAENGTTDPVGHGTKVAGIIAARPAPTTGFVGLAPGATIIPVAQNDADGHGTAETLAEAIRHAVAAGARIINISQDTADAVRPAATLKRAVDAALARDVVVVASAGNDGLGGNVKATYPASYPGVLAVAASDRNNERAAFSQSGAFVGVAAPGVDMVSTVPGGGHCADSGTSFAAPYVAGVAALIRARHPGWTGREVVTQIEQTAERAVAGHDRLVGWGVADPVRALTEDDHPLRAPAAHEGVTPARAPAPAVLHPGESDEERTRRLATYVAVGAAVLVAVLSGAAVAIGEARRRRVTRTE